METQITEITDMNLVQGHDHIYTYDAPITNTHILSFYLNEKPADSGRK